ncbi:restriction endonuclease subunit S [Yersinia pseudotuberculosis]|uniref:restriction endonuclease subunit S n=1 Tax=Yersinia pseudotuberculosis TaxID=633 RepID=UPI0004FFBC79|nr:restriction endonuclease subunit S [Yersinia pseudotuberculosis]KGA65868.1 type I restriction modification DNA specificity domain protein [Yersinia pseudotuberculosis]
MVPEGWKKVPLETIAEVRSGVAKGKSGLKDPITVQYLRVANVQDGHINLNDVKDIQIERHQLERYSLKFGDVLMNEGGDFDKLGRGDVWQAQIKPCLHQNHVFAVRPIPQEMDSFYLAALAASSYGKKYFLSCAKRSTNLASINSTQLKEFPVLVPPLPEQKKIAQILSTWDKVIATSEKLLANRQRQKKALMQKILTGRVRFSEFTEKWKHHELSDIAMIQMGSSPKSGAYNENGYGLPLIQGNADIKNRGSAPRIFTTEITKECDVGDILLSVRAPVGTVALSSHKACIGRGISAIRARLGFSQDFLYQWFLWFEPRWGALSQGSTFESINSDDIKQLKIKLPSLDEQKKIALILSNADQEIELLQQKLNHLKQEKKALMQQLLTGKRRVKVDAA